ncbi:MAG: hypothetical protein R6U78_03475 [Bacteroidales bacterium]
MGLLESTGEDVILMIQHFTTGDADFFAALFMYNEGAVAFIGQTVRRDKRWHT